MTRIDIYFQAAASLCKDNLLPFIWAHQKKIQIIALMAFSLLAVCYAACSYFSKITAFGSKPSKEIQELMNKLITNPKELLRSSDAGKIDRQPHMEGYPHLGECHCRPALSRPAEVGDLRRTLEVNIVEKIRNKFSTNRPLRILSIGAGRCFQELVLHAHLANLGYRIEWTLVDPLFFIKDDDNHDNINPQAILQEFQTLVVKMSSQSSVKTWFDVESFIGEYVRRQENGFDLPDVILAIDSDLESNFQTIGATVNQQLVCDPGFIRRHFVSTPKYMNDIQKLGLFVRDFKNQRIYAGTRRGQYTEQGFVRYFRANSSNQPQNPNEDFKL